MSLTGITFPVIGGGVTWQENADERAVRARSEQAEAFTLLWDLAQSAHIGVRNNFDKAAELADVHRQMNVLLIERSPALHPADVELAQEFLQELEGFVALLLSLPEGSADRAIREFAITADLPPMGDDFAALGDSYERLSYYNDLLRQRYRQVVYGEAR